jgi:hypothetical protein
LTYLEEGQTATVLQLPAAAVNTQGSEGSSVRLAEGLSA